MSAVFDPVKVMQKNHEELIELYIDKKLDASKDRSFKRILAIYIGGVKLLTTLLSWKNLPLTPLKLGYAQKLVAMVLDDYEQSTILRHRTCCFCDKKQKTLNKCKGCMEAMYCGRVCQTLDWAQHKRICFKLSK